MALSEDGGWIERAHSPSPRSRALIDVLRAYLPHLRAKHQVPGLQVALADEGRLVWEAGLGWLDVAARRPITPDTVYRSGSLGKTYVATAVMILVDRGVIALDDPINRHLPFAVTNPLGAREITVYDLMVHKAGLSADAGASLWAPGRPLAEAVEAEYRRERSPMGGGANPRWINPVGGAWTYSNLGIATLGLIVERANPQGLSFPKFVQREVMDPLGTTHSQYPRAQHLDFARADLIAASGPGYARMDGADIPSLPVYFEEYPAGGALQRPADHIRLLLAMMNRGELDGYRLFSPQIAAAMLAPATELKRTAHELVALRDFDGEQGLIWRLNDVGKPHFSFDHGGGHMFGWRTQGRAWPTYGAAFMIAFNQWSLPDDGGQTEEAAAFVGEWLRRRPPAAPRAPLSPQAVSYVRGVLAAAAYRVFTGIPDEPPPGVLDAAMAGVRDRAGDWDEAAYRRGFAAVLALPPTVEAVRGFWASAKSETAPDVARAAYRRIGGREPGMLSSLLPSAS